MIQIVTRDQITAVFKALRAQGFIALQNYKCCMSCACAALSGLPAERTAKATGIVYYHKQDGEVWDGIRKVLSLRYCHTDDTRDVTAIGRQITAALTAAGIGHEWSGSADEVIEVPVWA